MSKSNPWLVFLCGLLLGIVGTQILREWNCPCGANCECRQIERHHDHDEGPIEGPGQ